MKYRILVAEDETPIREGIVQAFRDSGYEVAEAESGRQAMECLENQSFDLVITDYRMPEGDGLQLLEKAQAVRQDVMVIVMTAYGTVEHAVEAIRRGAYDYVQKPFSLEDLELRVQRALEHVRLRGQVRVLEERISDSRAFPGMVGSSPAMSHIIREIHKVAPSNATILIQGETGTGKELVAEALHMNSTRSSGPFVKMNCAALPDPLLESELFGHERGAFTGADRQRTGRFELAHGGTLFLDEIGNMSHGTQAKVLRAIQEQEFERVGGTRTIKVDVRLVAATNRDLTAAMRQGEFREDLYYRLNVVNLQLPPLRNRKEDIGDLACHFVEKFAKELNKPVTGITPEAVRVLRRYNWPGNVRELENTLERAVLMTESPLVGPLDLAFAEDRRSSGGAEGRSLPVKLPPEGMALEEIEKEILLEALQMSNWVQKEAAALLAISSRAMNYKVKKYGITHPTWKKNRDPGTAPDDSLETRVTTP